MNIQALSQERSQLLQYHHETLGWCKSSIASPHMYRYLSYSRIFAHCMPITKTPYFHTLILSFPLYEDPSFAAFCAASCSLICLDQYLEGANLSG